MNEIDLVTNTEPYVRLAEVAERLGVKYETLLDWTKREDFPVLRLPGALRVRASDVARWLNQFQTVPAKKEVA
jgi:excisionase family DNA binding protein